MSITTGDIAPKFTVKDTNGKNISLPNGKNKLVLLFFPLAFSSVCTEELCSMRDNMKTFNSLNAKVAAISVDSFYSLKKFKKAENLNFTLLSDFNKKVSKKYDVLYDDFYGMKGVSKRAAFVIDEAQKVKYQEVLEDAGKMPDFSAIQQTLRGLG